MSKNHSELDWGLLAIGRSGQTVVEVDQSCGPEALLTVEISAPHWALRFRIQEPGIIQALASFLRTEGEQLIIAGTFDSMPVEVRRDREFDDRFFVVVGRDCARTEFIIAGQSVSELSSALSQAAEDLK
jgi:hypothetical protein